MQFGKNGNTPSLKITDFSDRELLAIARDLADNDGVVEIEYVARHIWPKSSKDDDWLWHARHCVAVRFAYMRRLGVVEKTDIHGQWELTSLGESVAAGRLKSTKLIVQTGNLYEDVAQDQADLMRREFQFRVANRKRNT
jgi:hypothetical protein